MALVLAMLATSMPWAPIVAFMVASPLTSPGQLLFTAGLFGWTFAGFHFAVAILLGLVGAAAATVLESRGWLANQMRLARPALAPIAGAAAPPWWPNQRRKASDARDSMNTHRRSWWRVGDSSCSSSRSPSSAI